MNKVYPISFAYNDDLPIGKVVFNIDEVISDKMLASMVIVPAYIEDPDGNIEIVGYGLITRKDLKNE